MKKNKYVILNFLLMISWMFVIFSFSQQNGDASQSTSDWVLKWLGLQGEWASYLIRKMAHWTEYAILGVLTVRFINSLGYPFGWAILIVVLFAFFDEFHQFFIPGRHAALFDVGVDSFGGLIGVLFFKNKVKKLF